MGNLLNIVSIREIPNERLKLTKRFFALDVTIIANITTISIDTWGENTKHGYLIPYHPPHHPLL
tara:strand:- start:59 stop:250 length:192 start_codon:yes stop_codon:yes gene_type:complete